MTSRVLNVFFRFFIEWTFASLILVIFHLLSSQQMPLLAAMGIAATASIIFTVLLEIKPNLAKPLYILVITPLLFLIGSLSNLEHFYTGIMALLIFWRVLKFQQDSTSHSESVWLVVTFLIGVFVSPLGYFYGGSYLNQIVFLLIFQLVFILSGQFLLKWMDVELGAKKRFIVTYSKLLGFILLLVAVLTFGRDILKGIFFIVLQGIGWTLSLLLYPFFSWIASPNMQERAGKVFPREMLNLKNKNPMDQGNQIFDPDFWGPILFALIIGFAFYFIYKKSNLLKRQHGEEAVQVGFVTTTSVDGPASRGLLTRKRNAVPGNLIRKEIFQLEKYAHKKELGRLQHEDVREWFNRLDIQFDPRTIQVYERVRYGGHLDENLDDWLKEEIKMIKKQITAQEKLRKEENNTSFKNNMNNLFRR